MTTDDALSAYVRQHAEQALLGLARFEYSTGEAIQREMTVEVVHATRTSLRRLRAVLRTFPESFPVPGPAACHIACGGVAGVSSRAPSATSAIPMC